METNNRKETETEAGWSSWEETRTIAADREKRKTPEDIGNRNETFVFRYRLAVK